MNPIFKAFASRDKDWADVKSIVLKNNDLNKPYIIENLTPLVELKLEPQILEKLNKIL